MQNLYKSITYTSKLLFSLLFFVSISHAAIVNVTNEAQLQTAITAATPGDVITLSPRVYNLTSTLTINTSLTLNSATGATALVALDGVSNKRVIHFNGVGQTLTLQNIQIQNGASADGNGGAGLWLENGTAIIKNTTFLNNSASTGNGGAIANKGTLTLSRSTFSGNSTQSASAFGNAISNETGATLTATYNTFIANNNPNNTSTAGALHNKGIASLGANILDNTVDCSEATGATTTSLGFNWQSAYSCTSLNNFFDLKNQTNLALSTLTTVNTIQVYIPLSNSSVIDKASTTSSSSLACIDTDAVNKTVPINTNCDIGAVEYDPPAIVSTTTSTTGDDDDDGEEEGEDGEFLGRVNPIFLVFWLILVFTLRNRNDKK